MSRPGLGVGVTVAAAVVALDQLTKHWALGALDDRDIDLVWTLRFHLTHNSGIAFGQAEGLGPVVGVIALVVVVGLLVSLRRHGSRVGAVAVGLVVGGALGNVIDRLLRSGNGFLQGAVVDFIDLQWWPIFNVADVAISVGAVLLVVAGLLSGAPAPEPAPSDPASAGRPVEPSS